MASDAFSRLPEEYLHLLRLAEEEQGLDVVPLHALSGGRTDAFVFLVSASSGDLRRVDHYILKLDRVNAKSRQTETERHRLALQQAPTAFAREHLAELTYAFRRGDAVALFYSVAGHSLQRVETLASLNSTSRLEALFTATHDFLLREWNAEASFERAQPPLELLRRWLGYRLAPDGQVASFLRERFGIGPATEGLLVRGQVYPNPLAFGLDSARWGGARPIDALVGFQHGDLNIGNVLVEFDEAGTSPRGFFLIDLALFKPGMPLLYDLAYLEMSYLVRELDRAPLDRWLSFVERFAESDMPAPKDVPVELSAACTVIDAGRQAFDGWVREVHPSVADDLWGQYRLAAVAAGVNFCNKGVLADEVRLAAIAYAASHLKRYCDRFGVPPPTDVRLLYGGAGRAAGAAGTPPPGDRRPLPVATTPFIGRASEMASLVELLGQEDTRLVTLTGPGGIGKTRLAVRLASEVADRFADGVAFVDLAGVADQDAVLPAIAGTVGVRQDGERPLLDQVVAGLGSSATLLVLDNFEQVTAAAPVVAELLAACDRVTFLVTSREALHLRGEHVFPVKPLAMPGRGGAPLPAARLAEFDAIRLFAELARAADPAFELTDANAPTVAEICTRLDGLPLAIELAAARLRMFPPQVLLERLQSRLKLLRGGHRDLPERQQTLRGTIDWSYDLLGAEEKRLLALLSVFQGCTLEAVETVALAADRTVADMDVLDGISSLVDKSLLQRGDGSGGELRLTMLETIREYAAEHLELDPAFATHARAAHAAHYAELARRQEARLAGTEREAALGALEADVGNLRSAWRHWVAEADLEHLHMLTDALWILYDARGLYQATVELTGDLLRVLSTTPSTPERVEQEILLQLGLARALLTARGYTEEVEQAYNRALELAEQHGEMPEVFPVLRGLSGYYTYRAEFDRAVEVGERILELGERLDDVGIRLEGHLVAGYSAAFAGRLHDGLAHLEESIAALELAPRHVRRFRFGTYPEVITHNATALVLWLLGYPDRALEMAQRALSLADALTHPFTLAYARFHSGLLHLWRREPDLTLARAEGVLEVARDYDFHIWMAVGTCLEGAALAGMGRSEEGLAQIRSGMAAYQTLTTRPPVFWPMLHAMHAGVAGQAGRAQEGLALLEEAMGGIVVDARNVLSSDLCRLRAELLLAQSPDDTAEAETWLRRALAIAEEAGARLLALRAATSLSRLRALQGEAEDGRRVLSGAYAEMTEGFAIADLQDAEVLLRPPG